MNRIYLSLVLRYGFLILVGLINLFLVDKGLFYDIFTPLTVHPSYYFLNAMYGASLISSSVIFFKGYYATIIPACIAGSAYYLLLILSMSAPMKIAKRTLVIFYLFLMFLSLNVFRIVFFGSLLFKGYQYFDLAHEVVWYFGSTVLVVMLWFSAVLIFRIKSIPFYTDMNFLFRRILT